MIKTRKLRNMTLRVLALLLGYSLTSYAQSIEREYLDQYGFPTERGSARSFRTVERHPLETRKLLVSEYMMNGSIKESTTYSDIQLNIKDGQYIAYYPSGQKKEEGMFRENSRIDKWSKWFSNKQLKQEGHYEEVKKTRSFKIDNSWDSLGQQQVVNQVGRDTNYPDYEYDSGVKEFDYEVGDIKDGLREGNWIGFLDGKVVFKEQYKLGDLVKGESFDKNGKSYPYEMINDFGLMPFYKFLASNMKYPPDARRNGIQGNVLIKIAFDKEGKIIRSRLVKGIGGGCDEEAMRVVNGYDGKWKDAMRRGQPFRKAQVLTLPITFRLG